MPITLTYGPISSALNLAKQSGEGQDFWRRFGAEQQVLDRLDRQTGQALQLRGMQESERRTDISTALAYDRMSQQERAGQESRALTQAYQAANIDIQKQRQAIDVTKFQQTQTDREAFASRFGMSPQEFQASQVGAPAAKKREIEPYMKAADTAAKAASAATKAYKKAAGDMMQPQSIITELRNDMNTKVQTAQDSLSAYFAATQQTADAAARNVLGGRGGAPAQATPEQMDDDAQSLAEEILRDVPAHRRTEEELYKAAIDALRQDGADVNEPDTQAFARLAVQKALSGAR